MEYIWSQSDEYEPFVPEEVCLHIPAFEELEYRARLLADPDTMAYNAGYDLPFDNYDPETGCIFFKKEQWKEWYEFWIDQEPHRFYAYVMRKNDGRFVGEVNVYENREEDCYETGVVIEAQYRGNGYGKQALYLLMRHAFYTMGAKEMHNSFEQSRYPAYAMHVSSGFVDLGTNEGITQLVCGKAAFERNRLKCLRARILHEKDAEDVLALYQSNPQYFALCPPSPDLSSVKHDMTALPEGADPSHKHYIGWYELNRLISVCDLIECYPDEDTVWLGLFMIRGTHHREGLGRGILEKLCAQYRGTFSRIALGCLENNEEGLSFWKSCGFEETGRTDSGIVRMEKAM